MVHRDARHRLGNAAQLGLNLRSPGMDNVDGLDWVNRCLNVDAHGRPFCDNVDQRVKVGCRRHTPDGALKRACK